MNRREWALFASGAALASAAIVTIHALEGQLGLAPGGERRASQGQRSSTTGGAVERTTLPLSSRLASPSEDLRGVAAPDAAAPLAQLEQLEQLKSKLLDVQRQKRDI